MHKERSFCKSYEEYVDCKTNLLTGKLSLYDSNTVFKSVYVCILIWEEFTFMHIHIKSFKNHIIFSVVKTFLQNDS